jgi:hypothetical protein
LGAVSSSVNCIVKTYARKNMYKPVNSKPDFPAMEEKVLEKWNK